MITLDQATSAVTILAAAFRSSMSEETAELYLRRFQSPPFDSFDVLMATVSAAVDMTDRLPPLAALLAAYQAEARARLEAGRAADQLALDRAGAARGAPTMDDRYGKAVAGVLRDVLTEIVPGSVPGAGDATRGHDHHQGAASCSVCSTADDTAAAIQARIGELLSARHVVPIPQPVPLRECQRCEAGNPGFVIVDETAAGFSVKPCPSCNTDAWQRWQNGGLNLRREATR